MKFVRFTYPNGVNLQINTPTSPAYRASAINWWGSDLAPARSIKGQFFWGKRGNQSPRAYVLWPTYTTVDAYATVFKPFDQSSTNHVYYNTASGWHDLVTQTIALPPTQAPGADIVVKVALVDNDKDGRPVILTVSGGGVTQTIVSYGPNSKDVLNLETIRLENVPAGTNQVVITLRSPGISTQYPAGGDSVAMIGAAVSYACVP